MKSLWCKLVPEKDYTIMESIINKASSVLIKNYSYVW